MLFCLALGALGGLLFAPFYFVFLLWIIIPLYARTIAQASSALESFFLGWLFFFGMFVASMHWIAKALFVDINTFAWALPFAVMGLPALLAIYGGLSACISWLWGMRRAGGILFFALACFAADVARGVLFTGFPWNLLGHAWGDILPMLQITHYIGIYGLTLITWLAASAPTLLLLGNPKKKSLLIVNIMIFVVAGIFIWGTIRIDTTKVDFVPDILLRLVQTDIKQNLKWKAQERGANLEKIIVASMDSDKKTKTPISPTHVIWPETAMAWYLEEETMLRRIIAARLGEGISLITGTVRREIAENGAIKYYNSIIVQDDRGNILSSYDKIHLVPWGEYFPLRNLLPGKALATLGVDFSFGNNAQRSFLPFSGKLIPFRPLVCYEAIFPEILGQVRNSVDLSKDNNEQALDAPEFLLNLTNDAWYEGTIGPAQHFEMARIRAIEEGIPLVRVANKGTVAVVDPLGRITAQYTAEGAGFVDSRLPGKIYHYKSNAWLHLSSWHATLTLAVLALFTAVVLRSREHASGDKSF